MARKMKNSGIEWINEIPESWEVNRIKNIFTSGKGLSITKENLIDNGLAVVSYGQIHSKTNTGVTIEDDLFRFVDFKYQKYYPQCQVYQYDFIFADTSEDSDGCGNCVYKRDSSILFAGYHSIILHSIIPQDNRYLAYLFKTDCWRKQIREVASGVKVFSITQKALINSSVTVPPFEEQQKIANYLDKKCAEIGSLSSVIESQISLLKDYRKAVITEAVTKGLNPDVEMKDSGIEWIEKLPITWYKARIGYNSWIRARLGWKGLKAEEYVDKGYAFLSAFNIINNQLNWNDLNYINQERYDESPEIKLCIGDIILVKDGAGIGKCARIDALPVGEATTNGSLAVISTYDSLNYKYLYYYLQSSMFQNYILRIMNGMGVPHLSQEHLRKIIIPIPPIKEQQEISDYLDYRCIKIDDAINEKREQLEVLEQYKKSLVYEYVTGKKEVIIND